MGASASLRIVICCDDDISTPQVTASGGTYAEGGWGERQATYIVIVALVRFEQSRRQLLPNCLRQANASLQTNKPPGDIFIGNGT
jgi:hypothetical protein